MFDIRDCVTHSIGVSALLVFVAFAAGCPHYARDVPLALKLPQLKPNHPAAGVYHTVGPNDDLSEIAKAYNVDLQHLAEVNNLKPPYSMKPYTRIFIPGATRERPIASSQKLSVPESRVRDFKGSLAWPVEGKIISEYGVRGGNQYNGISILARDGTPVTAAADGRVGDVRTIPGYGKVVLIEHADRLVTVYAHLNEIKVTNGRLVKTGEIIGTVGGSGRVEGPSLYFEVRSRSKPQNPVLFLKR